METFQISQTSPGAQLDTAQSAISHKKEDDDDECDRLKNILEFYLLELPLDIVKAADVIPTDVGHFHNLFITVLIIMRYKKRG